MNILLVEDNPDIVRSLSLLLQNSGYMVDSCARQDEAIEKLVAAKSSAGDSCLYDLALLDISLAQGNGFAVCQALKQLYPNLPVIFLTASDDEFNTVAGLSMGADDYIAKPFRPQELLARIRVVTQRNKHNSKTMSLGPLLIDPQFARVTKHGRDLELSATEYRLLLLFATHPNMTITREMMREALWDAAGAYIESNTLSAYIKRLREKIEDDPQDPQIITTVRGLGYRSHSR